MEMVATGIITIWKNVAHMVKALFKLAVLAVAVSMTVQLLKVTLRLTKEKFVRMIGHGLTLTVISAISTMTIQMNVVLMVKVPGTLAVLVMEV